MPESFRDLSDDQTDIEYLPDQHVRWETVPEIGYYGTAVPRFRRSGNRLSGAADANTKLLLG